MPKVYVYGLYPLGLVVDSWSQAQPHTIGVSNVRCKKFHSREDAEYYARFGKLRPPPASDAKTLIIYTDGSSQMIGDKMCAGIGVFFGAHSSLNLSERLPGDQQTNNRAELYAIHRALQVAPCEHYESVLVYSDSTYARKCLFDWRAIWQETDFQENTIKNRDLIEPLWKLLDEYPRPVRMEWSSGHAGIPGNEAADELADRGCRA